MYKTKKTMKRILLLSILTLHFIYVQAQNPDASWWTFSYPKNQSLEAGLLNLRMLNEKFAGEHGFIKMSKDGNSFVNGGDEPIRFWASNGGNLAGEFSDEKLDSLAKFLAKMGVNLIRYHGAINPHGKGTSILNVDTNEVKNIWRCVAAMKKQGIYTVISPFWPHNGHMGGWVPEEWGIDGYSGKDDLWAVMYFNQQLKEGYKAWVKYLYNTPNKYTGNALKDEPAVAIIQIENEDAVFFWTLGGIKPELTKTISKQFSQWLIHKYGSLYHAKTYWGAKAILPADSIENGMLSLYSIYELTLASKPENQKRLKDQVEFYADKQASFYNEMVAYYKYDLGCKQLINANNWRTASQTRLLDLERYTNSGADVMAVNKYFDPQHKGPNDGWRIDPGDFYGAPSATKTPDQLPTNIKHLAHHPMMVTESGWNLPNKYQTEGALLVAAYGGLTGLDAFFWFFPTAPTFATQLHNPYFTVNGQHPLDRWSNSTPGEIGMFPANALIHRLGYVKEAKILDESRTLNSLYNRDIPSISEEQPYDPNRDFIFKKDSIAASFSSLTFLTGGVSTNYQSNKDTTVLYQDLNKLIDTKQKKITSITAEQSLDYGNGLFTLNTPKAKAVSGFLNKQKQFDLGKVKITSENEYATIEVVSLDNLPLEGAQKILIQVGTIFRPTQWQEEESKFNYQGNIINGFKIVNTGKMPWLGMPAKGWIEIENHQIKKATLLDMAGYAVKNIPIVKSKNGLQLTLPANAYYILLE